MKNSKKIIIIAASLVIASVIVLLGCMHFLSEAPEETKEYNPDEMSLPSVIEETPTAQSELQKKFGAYGREETGENGEKIYRLFTEEQIAESLSLREKGERRSLTYEEIAFIVNDSIRMYFDYDKIIVTDFSEHVHPEPAGPLDYDIKLVTKKYDRCEVSSSVGYSEIIPYHGDYSECKSYLSAVETYNSIICGIETIILDRLRIHDTGTEGFCLTSNLIGSQYTRLYGILMDGGELTDSEKYISTLRDNLKNAVTYRSFGEPTYMYPLILTTSEYDPESIRPNLTISYIDGEKNTKLFPTEELEALRPDGKMVLTWKGGMYFTRVITLEFDRWEKSVKYTDSRLGKGSVLIGGYNINGNIISLHFGLSFRNIYLEYDGESIRVTDKEYYKNDHMGYEFEDDMVFKCVEGYEEDLVFPDSFLEKRK